MKIQEVQRMVVSSMNYKFLKNTPSHTGPLHMLTLMIVVPRNSYFDTKLLFISRYYNYYKKDYYGYKYGPSFLE